MKNSNELIVALENFGPISKGSVALRPLTVLTGRSNTGKSWFATLMYTFLSYTAVRQYKRFRLYFDHEIDKDKIIPNFVSDPNRWIDSIREENNIELSDDEKTSLETYLNKRNHRLLGTICRNIGVKEARDLIRWNCKGKTKIEVTTKSRLIKRQLPSIALNIGEKSSDVKFSMQNKLSLGSKGPFIQDFLLRFLNEINEKKLNSTLKLFINELYVLFFENSINSGDALFIPAGRVGLMDSFRTIVGSSVQTEIAVEQTSAYESFPFAGVLVDFLQNLASINSDTDGLFDSNIAKSIENNILEGTIFSKENQFGFPYFYFNSYTEKKPIPLNLSSSMISQLAPIILFVKYLYRPNQTIILEEPEVHLYPDTQVDLVNEIAKLIESGYRVIVTTHSETIIDALSNLVIQAENNPDVTALAPENVGFWSFSQDIKGTGTVISEVTWDAKRGGFEHTLDDAANHMMNIWLRERGVEE